MAKEPLVLLDGEDFLEDGLPKINQGIKNAHRSLTEMDESRNGYTDLKTRLSQSDVNLMNNPSFSNIPEYYEKAESITLVLTNSGRLGTRIDSATYVDGDSVKYKLLRNVNPNEDITVRFLANVFTAACRVRFRVAYGKWSEWEKIANKAGVDTWFKKTFNVGDFPAANAYNWLAIEFDKSLDIVPNTLVVAKGFDFSLNEYEGVKKQAINIDLLPEQLHGIQFTNLFNPAERTINKYITDEGFENDSTSIDVTRFIKVTPGETIGVNFKYQTPGGFFDHNKKWIRKFNFNETAVGSSWFTDNTPSNASYMRVNVAKGNLTAFMLKKSATKPTSYSNYGYTSEWLPSKAEILQFPIQPERLAGVEALNLYDDTNSMKNKYIDDLGNILDSTIINLSRPIVVTPGEVLGCNYKYSQAGVFLDEQNRFIKKIDFVQSEMGWYIVTVPENARVVRVNAVKNDLPTYMLKKTATKPKAYSPYGFQIPWAVMTTNKLLGKLIATFGDSITWLDGKVIEEAGKDPLKGYQYYMRKAGAIVDNFGRSGATIARSGISGVGSILDDIKKEDLTKYDIITIAGGTNDVGQEVNFGVVGSEEDTSFDETTTFGALRAAIEYIRSKNPKCRIYICTPIRSGRDTRPSAKMEEVSEGISKIAKMYSCALIDMLAESGIGKGNYATFLYDLLHPNNDGFRAMGEYFVGQMMMK
ncbi:SGNH/GDSL hydrolase family protein [Bacillus mycoides]|uniref:SGNH/GDSL hydrolase family protein n=1 Tax=Bacillus mycoides TaxID=1405 RepID=UPI0008640A41|nr:SGNH/GDSL hydrolase family protein [Bacillus mycoides]SCM88412.1 Uncharacterized protein BWAI21_03870 [Bacillus mycoides]